MPRLATAGYFVCWALAGAVSTLFCGASLQLTALLYRGYPAAWIDDDWTIPMVSATALLGLVAAWRTRGSDGIHRACRVLGLIVGLVGITIAVISASRVGATGGTGMISDPVYGIVALFFGVYTVIGVLMMGIGAFGAAANPRCLANGASGASGASGANGANVGAERAPN